jgi:hypothetical protein
MTFAEEEDIVTDKRSEKDIMMAKEDDLWSRIKTLAEKEDISYLEAIEKCVKEYWKDYGLEKES